MKGGSITGDAKTVGIASVTSGLLATFRHRRTVLRGSLAGTVIGAKEASVRLLVLPETGESPLPSGNSRFGRPTPQLGVEVERKWKRTDYHTPGNGLVQIRTT